MPYIHCCRFCKVLESDHGICHCTCLSSCMWDIFFFTNPSKIIDQPQPMLRWHCLGASMSLVAFMAFMAFIALISSLPSWPSFLHCLHGLLLLHCLNGSTHCICPLPDLLDDHLHADLGLDCLLDQLEGNMTHSPFLEGDLHRQKAFKIIATYESPEGTNMC
jgi:hypothetical protein